MSNPYDPPPGSGDDQSPYGSGAGGQQPYPSYGGSEGQQPYQPYGSSPGQPGGPYGSNPYGGPPPPPPGGSKGGTDGVSIAAFVLSLTCCLSVVGLIMGFFGLKRTKDRQRSGRWAAIAAIPIGILGTLVLIGGVIFGVYFAKNTVTIDNAKVGECINVSEDGDSVGLLKKDCSSDHDAQIVYKGKFSDIESSGVAPSNPDDVTDKGAARLVCSALIEDSTKSAIESALGDHAEYGIAKDKKSPSDDDEFICYVQRDDDDKISSKIG